MSKKRISRKEGEEQDLAHSLSLETTVELLTRKIEEFGFSKKEKKEFSEEDIPSFDLGEATEPFLKKVNPTEIREANIEAAFSAVGKMHEVMQNLEKIKSDPTISMDEKFRKLAVLSEYFSALKVVYAGLRSEVISSGNYEKLEGSVDEKIRSLELDIREISIAPKKQVTGVRGAEQLKLADPRISQK